MRISTALEFAGPATERAELQRQTLINLGLDPNGNGNGNGNGSVSPASLNPPFVVLTDGPTVTYACDAQKSEQNAEVTLGGNRVLAITGATNGMKGQIIVKQDATGSRTLTLPVGSRVQNSGNGVVTLTTTPNAHDVLGWVYNGTNFYWNLGQNFN